jgi:amino acid adenylation domain-containing protein
MPATPHPRGTIARLEDRVRRSAARLPNREALRIGPRRVTYAELLRVAESWATALRSARSDEAPLAIGLLSGRSFTGYVGILAAMCAGAAVYPLAPDMPPSRFEAMMHDRRLDALIVDSAGAAALTALAERCSLPPVFAPEVAPAALTGTGVPLLSDPGAAVRVARSGASDVAYVLYTSGSTGRPKGVPITHANMNAFLTNIFDRYEFTDEDVFTQIFDLTFDLAFFDLFVTWSCGGTLVCTPLAAFAHTPEFVAREGVTVWFSVPSAISAIRRLGGLTPGSLPSLRFSMFCGEALTWHDAAAWQAAAVNSTVENLYGPTELTIACSAHRLSPEDHGAGARGIVPIGALFPGLDGILLDEMGRTHPERGELCVSGPQMFSGYLDSADNADRFVEFDGRRWYRTGDLVRSDGAADLLYLGRTDQQTKIRGYRVELPEIEYQLRTISGVESAAVLAVGEGAERRLMAFCAGTGLDASQLKNVLHKHLPPYMVPNDYRLLERLPVNSRGKTDKHALAAAVSASETEEKQGGELI